MGVKNTASKNRIALSKSGEEKRAIRYFLKIFLSHFLHCSPVAQWIAIHLEIRREVQVIPVNRYELVAIIETARNTGLFYRVFLQSFSTKSISLSIYCYDSTGSKITLIRLINASLSKERIIIIFGWWRCNEEQSDCYTISLFSWFYSIVISVAFFELLSVQIHR